jgi:hypothetical protein
MKRDRVGRLIPSRPIEHLFYWPLLAVALYGVYLFANYAVELFRPVNRTFVRRRWSVLVGIEPQAYRRPGSSAPTRLSVRARVPVPVAKALGCARVAARPFDSEEPERSSGSAARAA